MYVDRNGKRTQDIQCAVDSNVESRELEHKKWELLEDKLNSNPINCLQAIFDDESCMNTMVTAIKTAMLGDAKRTQEAMLSVINAQLAYHKSIEDAAYEILEAA